MTFFLNEFDPAKQQPARGPDMQPTGFMEGLGATTSTMMRDTNANFLRQREVRTETFTTVEPAARRVGIEALNERYQRDEAGYDHLRPAPTTVDEFIAMHGDIGTRLAMDLAREQAAAEPDRWKDLDLTDEGIQKRVTERRIAEDADEAQIRSMMPKWGGVADLAGGLIGATADVRNLPFLAFGGGGSVLRVMGREAFLNAAAEGVTLPSQFATAEELGKADPNVAQQLAFGAVGGAVIGGAMAGLGRAVEYFRDRQAIPKVPGVEPVFHEAAVGAAEDALVTGDNPLRAVQRVIDQSPASAPPPPAGRAPLLPTEPPEFARIGETTGQPVEPAITVEPIPPEGATNLSDLLDQSSAAIARAEAEDSTRAKPLVSWLRAGHKPSKAARAAGQGDGPSYQIHPEGKAAGELRAMGINARTAPGLFSKAGRKDFDNLVASELEDTFPGIREATNTAPDATYLDRQGFLDLIVRDASGDASWLRSRAEVQRLQREQDEMLRGGSAIERFTAGEKSPTGLFIDANDLGFLEPDDVGRMFDEWMESSPMAGILTPQERAEIVWTLQTRGGDAEFLVERAAERELEWASDGSGDSAASGAGRQGGEPPFGPDAVTGQTGSGAAREGDGGSAAPASERTAAGDQLLVPGVAPVSTRQRLEARQDAPKRGGTRPMDEGLFDVGSRSQMDMFDDPRSKEARVIQDNIAADFRDQVDAEDFMVDMGDGKGERRASSILDELEGDDEFNAILDACGKPVRTEA